MSPAQADAGIIHVLLIPTDEDTPVRLDEAPADWPSVHRIVGASIDMVELPGTCSTMFVEAAGKMPPAKPRNRRAEALRNLLLRRAMDPEVFAVFGQEYLRDWLAGAAVVVGQTSEGEPASVDADIVTAMANVFQTSAATTG